MKMTVIFQAERKVVVDAKDADDAIRKAQAIIETIPPDWEWVDIKDGE